MDVVVVESPAKAKTINKYLGSGYTVLASIGHVRDLPAKDGSVRPDEDFAMSWQVSERAGPRLAEIARALKGAEHLYLATDPDREGEAISWHVQQVLQEKGALDRVEVKRVVFHEVTKSAVLEALKNPRDINAELVEAYFARRALDYLVGFTLSPVLWRKLPGSKSAGRVQSVALRLICEREAEIEIFKAQEYWSVEVAFKTPRSEEFTARLTHLDGERLEKHSISGEDKAKVAVAAIEAGRFAIAKVEKKQVRRNPQPPFTTSTLQQEASRKLRFAASRTMRLAQQLYEGINIGGETVGLITYMRTDSVVLSREAIESCRTLIARKYGGHYVPDTPRVYKTKAKNAQEAHEAIRPTDLARQPKDIAHYLDEDQLRLYKLIWKRTVASEMESARLDQVIVDIAAEDARTTLRANGSVIAFDGFLAVYREGQDDLSENNATDDRDRLLPPMQTGEALDRGAVTPEQHFTQPPPRFTEASLVKRLEELGIGRPSTYASIIQVLQDRDYVKIDSRRFVPEDRGRVVTTFLSSFFKRYVEYDFTADLENQLDEISNGTIEWKAVLREFWTHFSQAIDGTKDLTITQVIDSLDEVLGPHFFPPMEDGTDPRKCPTCEEGRIGLKLGKFGAFIGCSNYPECRYTRPLAIANDKDGAGLAAGEDVVIGEDPETGKPVSARNGPYGPYLQLGAAKDEEKPKRVSLPKGLAADAVDLPTALKLLALPREVGAHPESGKLIRAGIGRYGPYVQHEKSYKSLETADDVLSIGLNRAVDLLAQPSRGRGANGPGSRPLGEHPDGKAISAGAGRYGPYVRHGKTFASLPKDVSLESVTLEQAIALIDAKNKRGKSKPAKAKSAKKRPPARRKKAKSAPRPTSR
ncbi:MAG: type I DNA topoisomerase [Alphaproteobacteria bacterium]|nr:type I DNA topoisomerase [Alphaproteobacteria bacterium]